MDYRLAPETPHPGPVEDCYAALKWLYTHAGELDVYPTRIAIGGGSAGGGLAAGRGLLARDRGEVPLVFQLLIFPMLDDRTVTRADPHPYTGEFLWTVESNRFGWRAEYFAICCGGPCRASGGPAFHLHRRWSPGLFLEEKLEYAWRRTRSGVPTEPHVYPGAYHGFPLVAGAWMSQALERDQLAALPLQQGSTTGTVHLFIKMHPLL